MIRRGELSAPLSVFLDVTNRCNLLCRHCSASAGRPMDGELSTEQWLAVIRRLSALKIFDVTVSGGEPFLRPDIFELLAELGQGRLPSKINTNATLMDDETAQRLGRLSLVRGYGVSLDGGSAAVHDAMRGPGAFDRAVRGIEVMVRNRLPLTIGAVVTRLNQHDLENMIRVAKELGAQSIGFNSPHPAGRMAGAGADVELTAGERQAVAERLTALKEEHDGFVSATFLSWHRLLSAPPRPGTRPGRIHICGAGLESCAIRPNGDVIACNAAPDYVCGNVRSEDLASIWRDSPRLKALRDLTKRTAEDVDGCRSCDYRFSCNTGCRADAWQTTGSWTGAPTAICWQAAG